MWMWGCPSAMHTRSCGRGGLSEPWKSVWFVKPHVWPCLSHV
ncbi:hypothetical protein JI435_414940 [Parastagonospora nodorum SN15]|uniref:Uncharacterized protein n=1 Tax=Phaeosphaeria nodorum (strain SN15 / ATCC MYA-4574 / FGSC 10173) TaxID=321614 RepID=A0A7U2FC35_PHANO|nr:hypothetical protein JI435_414940 [Parastagonospora nodorum SN15]